MSARWLLHRIDAQNARGLYVRATAEAVREAAFLDGRTQCWDAEEVRDLPATPAPNKPLRYIFHGSFCGSTLLARLLDQAGASIVLREPQAYVDVANAAGRFLPTLSAAMADMGARDEAVVVKPTNWANTLIPLLTAPEYCESAVFVSQPLPDFLRAVLRGGRDRLAYTARAAAHVTAKSGLGEAAMARAGEGAANGIEHILRMAAVLHAGQDRLFRDAMTARGWGAPHYIDYAQIAADPAAAAVSASRALGLPLDLKRLEQAAAARTAAHSKDAAQQFSERGQADADAAVMAHHGATLSRVTEWAQGIVL